METPESKQPVANILPRVTREAMDLLDQRGYQSREAVEALRDSDPEGFDSTQAFISGIGLPPNAIEAVAYYRTLLSAAKELEQNNDQA